jgi:hypothetical protein
VVDGGTREEIAECMLLLSRSDEASPHFARVWELLSENATLLRRAPVRSLVSSNQSDAAP